MIQRATGPIHVGSSVESGFEPGTLPPQSRDLTTMPPQPLIKAEAAFPFLTPKRNFQTTSEKDITKQICIQNNFEFSFTTSKLLRPASACGLNVNDPAAYLQTLP
ncbi:hypothetical protein AVEN_113781-1 [Araneus ventricosus]|uniref:Uncharacterized protein n=1 Tax=Araneus ventricosus TaxID=182803 RepID=A0A4Y2WPJ1_ARAVE|nr:hypothetical protein AVEN_113781-1 [Araneus ventricosus]